MFAVIRTGGKQYRVAADQVLKVDKVAGAPGEIIQFGEVLMFADEAATLGTPSVQGASVAAEVIEQGRGAKIIAFKKRRRQNSRRKRGHRQEFTMVRITEILTEGRTPTIEARVRRKPEAVSEPAEAQSADEAAPKKARAKKAAPAKSKAAKPKAAAKKAAKPAAKSAKTAKSAKKTTQSGGKATARAKGKK